MTDKELLKLLKHIEDYKGHATREEQMDVAKRYDIYNGYQKVLKRRK